MSTKIADKGVYSCFNGTQPAVDMSYDTKEIELIYRVAGHLADGETLDEEVASMIEFAVTLTHAGECAALMRTESRAPSPSGKARVCKTLNRRFDSARRLQTILSLTNSSGGGATGATYDS